MGKGNKRIWMWLLCIAIIGCAAGYICFAFNRVETDGKYGEYIENGEGNEEEIEAGKTGSEELAYSPQRGKHLRGNWGQIMTFVEEQLPELDDIGYYIEHKTEGKASLVVDIGASPTELYDNSNNFLGYYYSVYVGEQWEDHRANWDWFYVSDEIDEILWCEIVNIEYYTLEEWRSSSHYKEWINTIREFREANSEGYAATSNEPSWRVDEVEDGYEISFYDEENNIYFPRLCRYCRQSGNCQGISLRYV